MSEEDALIIKIPLRLLRELSPSHPAIVPPRAIPTPDRSLPARGWSEGQKRLLYRILQGRGCSDDDARRYIEDALGLSPQDTPSMVEASRLIDRLKVEDDGGSRGVA